MILVASFVMLLAYILTGILVTVDYGTEPSYSFLASSIILGLGYSVYTGALFSSVPFVVKPYMVGTAFGLIFSIQNGGLTVLPIAVASTIQKSKKYNGYVHEQMLLTALALISLIFNAWLYLDDIKKRDGKLDKVLEVVEDGDED
jgi:nitrate/nitrite transporter NarK